MMKAESPRLREKVRKLGLDNPARLSPAIELGRIVTSLETKTWHVLLANLKTPSLRDRSHRKRELLVENEPDDPVQSNGPDGISLEGNVDEFLANIDMQDDAPIQGVNPAYVGSGLEVVSDRSFSLQVPGPLVWPDGAQSQSSCRVSPVGWDGSSYPVEPELVDSQGLHGNMGEVARHHLSTFYSSDDWLNCTGVFDEYKNQILKYPRYN